LDINEKENNEKMNGASGMKLDISKILNISARISGAISVSCLLILFFPSAWLPFDIDVFREQHGLWIFVIMVIAISLSLSYVVKWIIKIIIEKVEIHKTRKSYRDVLENLSPKEKKLIRKQYDKKETAIIIDISNPMMKKLETFEIISVSAGMSAMMLNNVPGYIQPWVFKTIDRYPNILDTEYKSNE